MDKEQHGSDGKTYEKSIKTIVKDRWFAEEALSTFLIEVESIINSRPFTPASNDIYNLEPITPNYLLLDRPSLSYKPRVTNLENINLRKIWKAVEAVIVMFYRRSLKVYVTLLA